MNRKIISEETMSRGYRTMVGDFVRQNREKKKMSLDDLAMLLNINSGTVAKIESGKFPVNVDLLEKLSQILGFDMHLLPKQS